MPAKDDKRLKIGVLGCGPIAQAGHLESVTKARNTDLYAICDVAEDLLHRFAVAHGASRTYTSYDAMLGDPDLDAVIVATADAFHVPASIAALEAGKHVLCEKPIALNAKEAEGLRECPKDRIVMEAFMVRFHPQWQRAREIARSGELGELRAIRAAFCYYNDDADNVRNQADIGGGGIMDIGCYPITAARYLFESEPLRVVSLVDRDPDFKTDRLASVLADFGYGRQLSFTCSTQAVPHQTIELIGTKGRVEIVIPFNAPPDSPTALIVDNGVALDSSLARREIIRPVDQYTEQAEAFALAVLGDKPLHYGIEDSILNMRVIDAVFESEKTGGWSKV